MLEYGNVANMLGLAAGAEGGRSQFEIIDRIEAGLPLATVDRIAQLLAPGESQFKYRLIPKATYDRRKSARAKLSAAEGARVTRIARVWSQALDVWKEADAARGFLLRPHPMIEDRRPVDVIIQSEFGAEMVADILGGLKHGSAA